MKKLMIAAAIVCAAALSEAAVINWSAGQMKLADGSSLGAKGDIVGYLFMIDKDTFDGYVDNGYTATGAALSKQLWADYGKDLASADANKQALKNGNLLNINVMNGDVAKQYDPGTYYAALVIVDKVTKGDYVMGNIGKAVVGGALDTTVADLGFTIFGDGATAPTTATAWYSTAAVPEPTSGLLLLLGVAGLALRRRRA